MEEPRPSAKAGGLGWLVTSALIFVFALCQFTLWGPVMPSGELDASWALGMNQAVAQGLVFGRDVIFTFGPYAEIYTHLYHPATDALVFGSSLVLAVSFGAACAILLRQAGLMRQLLFVAASLAFAFSADALLLAYPLVAGVVGHRLVAQSRSARGRAPLLAALFFGLGLLPLVKGSALVLCAVVVGLVTLELLLAGLWASAVAAALSPVLATLMFWTLAGQPLSGLPSYFASSAPIISGYTEAMASDGWPREPALYAAATLVLVILLAREERGRLRQGAVLILIVLAALFLSFKGGFVRHDGHAGLAGVTLVLVGTVAASIYRSRAVLVGYAVSVLVGLYIISHYSPLGMANPKGVLASAWQTIAQRRHSDVMRAGYDRGLKDLAKASGFPRLPGSSDVYTLDQAFVIASGNRWNPRPILQSYSAYLPLLADKNRRHLEETGAPDNVFFHLQPIDNRLPSLDDGASWPSLLTQYRVDGRVNDFLILRRIPGAASPALTSMGGDRHRFAEPVPVPASDDPVFVRMTIKPTLLGRAANILFKTSHLQITQHLANGGTVRHRIVSGMTETGFLLSPAVGSTQDLVMLYGDPRYLASHRVVSMSVEASHGGLLWNTDYSLQFLRLPMTRDASVARLFDFEAPFVPPTGMPVQPAGHCDGNVDLIDGASPPPPHVSASGQLQVSGWMSPSTERGEVADRILAVLTDIGGRHVFYPVKFTPRGDVAAVFRKPALSGTGFTLEADVSTLNGAYSLGLAYVKAGSIQLCPQFHTPLSLG